MTDPRTPRGRTAFHCNLVYEVLVGAEGPMTAYELLYAVRPAGISAPPTIYRALARLVARGLAHRIESLNAYVACTCEHRQEGHSLFLICDRCGNARELAEAGAFARLAACAGKTGFEVERASVEMHGVCAACVAPAGSGS